MKLTRQHFELVAGVLRELHAEHGDLIPSTNLVRRFATALQAHNPRFIRDRFELRSGLREESTWTAEIVPDNGGYIGFHDLVAMSAKAFEDGGIEVKVLVPDEKPVELLLDRQRAGVLIELLKLVTAWATGATRCG